MAAVTINGKTRNVKNLAWLKLHAHEAEYLVFYVARFPNQPWKNQLVVHGQLRTHGGPMWAYSTEFASLEVCWDWVTKRGGFHHKIFIVAREDCVTPFVVGTEKWLTMWKSGTAVRALCERPRQEDCGRTHPQPFCTCQRCEIANNESHATCVRLPRKKFLSEFNKASPEK